MWRDSCQQDQRKVKEAGAATDELHRHPGRQHEALSRYSGKVLEVARREVELKQPDHESDEASGAARGQEVSNLGRAKQRPQDPAQGLISEWLNSGELLELWLPACQF